MTVPMWAPFALLTVVCAVWPPPAWIRRVDWPKVTVWFGPCLCFWTGVGVFAWWLA